MSPLLFLAVMIAVTGAGCFAQALARSRRRRALRELADEWHMRYVPGDLFHIGRRIAATFPIEGASDLLILDLIYGTQGQRHRYVFTAQYSIGPITRPVREERVMTFCEDKDSGHGCANSPMVLGDEGLRLVEQYRRLGKLWEQK
jgi:hypothetical protein